jgi:hypothetical protein
MKNAVVIKPSSLPPRPPILFAAVFWLLLDRLNAPEWAFGVLWTLVGILLASFVYRLCNVDIKDVPGFGGKS